MQTIDPNQTLGELAAERPDLTAALERLHLDYCCGGGQTLADACGRRGLDPATVAIVLAEVGDGDGGSFVSHDLRGVTIAELCNHIVFAHHEFLRRELPRIARLAETVLHVHGGEHAELQDVHRLFFMLERELPIHIDAEERTLFPLARAVASGETAHAERAAAAVAAHLRDHDETAGVLVGLRELTDGYRVAGAYCSTHRSLLAGLEALEADLHQHIHEENNLLFPRVLAAFEVAQTR